MTISIMIVMLSVIKIVMLSVIMIVMLSVIMIGMLSVIVIVLLSVIMIVMLSFKMIVMLNVIMIVMCHNDSHAECHKLAALMLSDILLKVIRVCVFMLIVVALPEGPARSKHCRLFRPLASYKENKVFQMCPQHFDL
jgi:hypothetical protein